MRGPYKKRWQGALLFLPLFFFFTPLEARSFPFHPVLPSGKSESPGQNLQPDPGSNLSEENHSLHSRPFLIRKIAQDKDVTPPRLVDISLKLSAAGVTAGPTTVTITAHIKDDMAGVKEWGVVFVDATGDHFFQVSGNPGLMSGTAQDGTFRGTGTLPAGKAGKWNATLMTLTDGAGNTTSIKPGVAGFNLSFTQEPPQKVEGAPTESPLATDKGREAPPSDMNIEDRALIELGENPAPKPDESAAKEQAPPPEGSSLPEEKAQGEAPAAPPSEGLAKEGADAPLPTPGEVTVEKPALRLTLKDAIRTALTGNRPYLDRLDAMRQQFGVGQITSEQVVSVPSVTGAAITEVRIPGAATGLAAAQAQFEPTLNPFITVQKNGLSDSFDDAQNGKSYGIGLAKKFITGGIVSLDVTSPLNKPGNYDSNSLNISFTQPLLRGAWPLVVNEPIVSAQSDLMKEELNIECCDTNSRQKLIYDVISQYNDIKNQLELVEIAKLAVDRANRLYRATDAKMKVDLATQLDLSRAEIQLSTQQRSLNQAMQDLGTKDGNLKILLGLAADDRVELTDPVVYQASDEVKEIDLQKLIEKAMRSRPDLRAEQMRVDDVNRKLKIARRDYLPDLSFNATKSVPNLGGRDPLNTLQPTWTTSLTLRYPLPFTSQKVNVEQNVVALQREKRLLVEKRENIIRDIKTDLINVVKSQEQIVIVKREIASAEKKLKIANFRFDRGLASNFDIVDAENNMIQARQNMTQTIVRYLSARSKLDLDMGVLAY